MSENLNCALTYKLLEFFIENHIPLQITIEANQDDNIGYVSHAIKDKDIYKAYGDNIEDAILKVKEQILNDKD